MKISWMITRLRDRLDESTANIYTDVELARYIDEAIYDAFRTQAQVDESWHNCEFDLINSTDGTQLHTNLIAYDLPHWVHKVTGVREKSDSTSNKNQRIPCRTLHNNFGDFWAYQGFNRIVVSGTKASEDLTVECSKIPAPLSQGTLVAPDTLTFSTTQIHWDTSSTSEGAYQNIYEDNWYLNSIFEFTGVDSGSHAIAGSVVRGLSSTVSYDTDALFQSVTFDSALSEAPQAGDTWEMHAEVQPANVGFILALAAHKAFIRKSNFEAITALTPDLERERLKFIESITPRQDQILPFAGMEDDYLFNRDPDRDWAWGGR